MHSDQAQPLTPYDTGDRLEPHPWVRSTSVAPMPRLTETGLVTPDDFGRVDFDDEESRSVLGLYVERTDHGYVLHLNNLIEEALTISGDAEAIVLGIEHRAGIEELLELAARGRAAAVEEAERTGQEQDEQDAATLRWVTAHNAAVAIRRHMWSGEEGQS